MKDEAFSVRLKTLMARKSLKIGELAKIMKCSKPAVSAWRGGKIPPSPDTQKRLAAALGVGVETLVFGINFGGGGECPIFSNELPPAKSKTPIEASKALLKENIRLHISELVRKAEKKPCALEHLYLELKLRLPLSIYNGDFADSPSPALKRP